MKELTTEEKAQAYDEAIKRAKSKIKNDKDHVLYEDDIIELFPELAESEDERIRKALIDGFTVMKESKNCGKTFSSYNIPVADILAWLEKQGKQKFANSYCQENCKIFQETGRCFVDRECKAEQEYIKQSLKDSNLRLIEQKPAGWSEYDELSLKQAIYVCHQNGYTAVENWLKSLRPQKHWKPSEEQMKQLGKYCPDNTALTALYEYLKQL